MELGRHRGSSILQTPLQWYLWLNLFIHHWLENIIPFFNFLWDSSEVLGERSGNIQDYLHIVIITHIDTLHTSPRFITILFPIFVTKLIPWRKNIWMTSEQDTWYQAGGLWSGQSMQQYARPHTSLQNEKNAWCTYID